MATGTTELIDATTADALIPEMWSQEVIAARKQKLLFADFVNRTFEKEMKYGDVVHIPSKGHLTTQTKNRSANAATIFETVTESNTDLSVTTWQYNGIALETATRRQTNRDMLDFYAPEQGYTLALAIDDVLAGLPDDFSNSVGTLGVELTYEDVLRARQYLRDADVPLDDVVIVTSPAQETGFMKLDQFVHADYRSLNDGVNQAAKDAFLGNWMRMPVYVSTNVEGSNGAGHDSAMFHREAIALVVQMKPTTHMEFDINYLADKVVVEQLHGSGEIRDDHGVWMKSA